MRNAIVLSLVLASPAAFAANADGIAPSRTAMTRSVGPIRRLVLRAQVARDLFRVGVAQRAFGARGQLSNEVGPEKGGQGLPGMRAMLKQSMKLALDGKMWGRATQVTRTPIEAWEPQLNGGTARTAIGYTLSLTDGSSNGVGRISIGTYGRAFSEHSRPQGVDWYSDNVVELANHVGGQKVSYHAINRGGHPGGVEASITLDGTTRYERDSQLTLDQVIMNGGQTRAFTGYVKRDGKQLWY